MFEIIVKIIHIKKNEEIQIFLYFSRHVIIMMMSHMKPAIISACVKDENLFFKYLLIIFADSYVKHLEI